MRLAGEVGAVGVGRAQAEGQQLGDENWVRWGRLDAFVPRFVVDSHSDLEAGDFFDFLPFFGGFTPGDRAMS